MTTWYKEMDAMSKYNRSAAKSHVAREMSRALDGEPNDSPRAQYAPQGEHTCLIHGRYYQSCAGCAHIILPVARVMRVS
jgi:hypothetical protein